MNYDRQVTATLVVFLHSINISVVKQQLPDDTILPGLSILGSSVLMDTDKLKYPGDILHEAGHIAVTDAEVRPLIGTSEIGEDWPDDGNEIAAILWSFAACHYLKLDLEVCFPPVRL